MFNVHFRDRGCVCKSIRDAGDQPLLEKTKSQFLFPTKVRAEPVTSNATFETGVYVLNPHPLTAVTSEGTFAILSSSDDEGSGSMFSASEEDEDFDTSETSSFSLLLAELEQRRAFLASQTSHPSKKAVNIEAGPSKKKRKIQRPKKPQYSLADRIDIVEGVCRLLNVILFFFVSMLLSINFVV